MPKKRGSIEQKKQHIIAWRDSGLTRRQYCELHVISFASFREWPRDIANAEQLACKHALLPVHIAGPVPPESFSAALNEPVTLFLPRGIRLSCHPSQLTDVFRALRYADA